MLIWFAKSVISTPFPYVDFPVLSSARLSVFLNIGHLTFQSITGLAGFGAQFHQLPFRFYDMFYHVVTS